MLFKWEFEKVGRRHSTSGGAFRNPLEGVGMSREAKLAREAIQNSCDAAASQDHAVKVIFWKSSLIGEAKAQFAEALLLDQLLEGRASDLHLSKLSALRSLHIAVLHLTLKG